MRYIEKDLPIEKLNVVALREGNSKRPIYRMHKWWARRLGSVFRTLLLATFCPETASGAEVWRRFYQANDLQGKVVLDPFMGGGTTVVEALRLGCKVVGVDVNPVAWFVSKKEVEAVDLKALDQAFRQVEQAAGRKILRYYRTTCHRGHLADVLYYFWVKEAPCLSCGHSMRLFPNYEILHKNSTSTVVCPQCFDILVISRHASSADCPQCTFHFDPTIGNAGKGTYTCSRCGYTNSVLDAVKRNGKALSMHLFALEYHCSVCGRSYKRVDENDRTLFEEAKQEFAQKQSGLLFPTQAIPFEGRSDPRPVNHGYKYFWQMFNERQLLCLSTLLEEIDRIPDQNVKEFLLIAFSDALDANNMFCKYEVDYQKISLLFGLHAYHPIERPAENNVWGGKFGRGTFVKCYEKVKKAKMYAAATYERGHGPNGDQKFPTGERIEGIPAVDFAQLAASKANVLLSCRDSRDLSFIPAASVDAVVTDPPYFDNVVYSELSDFFYVWLRLLLKQQYPWFEPELPLRDVEIIQNNKVSSTVPAFAAGLTAVFKECARVLKSDGVLVFTFHHNKLWAWQELMQIILNAGFYVSGAPIVRSEGKSGFHSSEGNIKYDACLVCRRRPSEITSARWSDLRHAMMDKATQWIVRLSRSGMTVNRVDVFAITMAKLLEVYTKHWPNVTDGAMEVDIGRAIGEANMVHHALADGLSNHPAYVARERQGVLLEDKMPWGDKSVDA